MYQQSKEVEVLLEEAEALKLLVEMQRNYKEILPATFEKAFSRACKNGMGTLIRHSLQSPPRPGETVIINVKDYL